MSRVQMVEVGSAKHAVAQTDESLRKLFHEATADKQVPYKVGLSKLRQDHVFGGLITLFLASLRS